MDDTAEQRYAREAREAEQLQHQLEETKRLIAEVHRRRDRALKELLDEADYRRWRDEYEARRPGEAPDAERD